MINVNSMDMVGSLGITPSTPPNPTIRTGNPPASQVEQTKKIVEELKERVKGLSCKVPNHNDTTLTVIGGLPHIQGDFCCAEFEREIREKVYKYFG